MSGPCCIFQTLSTHLYAYSVRPLSEGLVFESRLDLFQGLKMLHSVSQYWDNVMTGQIAHGRKNMGLF